MLSMYPINAKYNLNISSNKHAQCTPSGHMTNSNEFPSGAKDPQEDCVKIEALTEHPEVVTQHEEIGEHVEYLTPPLKTRNNSDIRVTYLSVFYHYARFQLKKIFVHFEFPKTHHRDTITSRTKQILNFPLILN